MSIDEQIESRVIDLNKSDRVQPNVQVHKRLYLKAEAEFAEKLMTIGLLASVPGEQLENYQAMQLVGIEQVVARSCDIAAAAFAEFERRGWVTMIPKLSGNVCGAPEQRGRTEQNGLHEWRGGASAMTALSPNEPHHWAPIPEVVNWLCDRLPVSAKVVEIGPGHAPFPLATAFVDFDLNNISDPNIRARTIKCDLSAESLPFPDKSFDFVYARHVLEDSWNPFHICQEMSRVAKAGYLETPSPIAEVTRGVDGGGAQWRGYHHHRWVIWEQNNTLALVSKYPLCEIMTDRIDSGTAACLRLGARYWNSYHLWEGEIRYKHFQSPLDFDILRGYAGVLAVACEMSRNATERFFAQMKAA